MFLENNITKEKTSRINAIKDKIFREEMDLERTLALNAALATKLSLFQNLRDRAEGHTEANREILMKIEALARFLGGLGSETTSLTQLTQKALNQLMESLQRLQRLCEQVCVIAEMLKSLKDMLEIRRSKNPLISSDLIAAMDRSIKTANEALAASLAALDSCIPSVRQTEDSLGSWRESREQLLDLNRKVVGNDEDSKEKSFLCRMKKAKDRSSKIGKQASDAYEIVNEQFLAIETRSLIDQALLDSTVAALKAAQSAVASSSFR